MSKKSNAMSPEVTRNEFESTQNVNFVVVGLEGELDWLSAAEVERRRYSA